MGLKDPDPENHRRRMRSMASSSPLRSRRSGGYGPDANKRRTGRDALLFGEDRRRPRQVLGIERLEFGAAGLAPPLSKLLPQSDGAPVGAGRAVAEEAGIVLPPGPPPPVVGRADQPRRPPPR